MSSYADPTTQAFYDQPWAGAMRRGFLESAASLARQPQPVPVRQHAGLDPYEMQARQLAGGLGGFTPYIQQGGNMMQGGYGAMQQGVGALPMAQQFYGQGAGLVGQGTGMYGQAAGMTGRAADMFAPGAAQQFYNPYEDQVVQGTIEQMNQQNQEQGQADRARAVSSGAFGGSRGRLMEQEREKSFGRGLTQAVGGLRQQGWQQAQQAAQQAGQGLGTLGSSLGQFGQGLGALGGQLGNFGQGITSMAGQYGNLGQGMGQMGGNFAGLGMTGQRGLMNQIGTFDRFGQTGRGIQDQMYGAQFDAANRMGAEPWNRLTNWKNMMSGMLPQGANTTWNPQAGSGLANYLKFFGMV